MRWITKLTVGNEIKANDSVPVITINEIDPIKAQFSLSQKYYAPLKQAMQRGGVDISVEIPESKEKLKVKLESIENTFDQNQGD